MRPALLFFAAAALAAAQFRATAPLVVVPVAVTDAKGKYVDGIAQEDLLLYDNSVRQQVQADWMQFPISLVVALQTSENSGAVIDKLGGSGILLTELVAADRGETAVLSFSDRITLRQDFTANPEEVTYAMRMLRKDGGGAHVLDALEHALHMLEGRPAGRRRVILVVGEKRDRGSAAKLPQVMELAQRVNAAIYWLTYSPFLQPFTVKPKTKEDLKPEAERIKMPACSGCPKPDDTPVPPDLGPGGLIYSLGELVRLRRPDLSEWFTRTTGGRSLAFLKKGALEHAVQLAGEEIHRQYILTFQPKNAEPGKYHRIRVEVKGRPELNVKAREGYWAVD